MRLSRAAAQKIIENGGSIIDGGNHYDADNFHTFPSETDLAIAEKNAEKAAEVKAKLEAEIAKLLADKAKLEETINSASEVEEVEEEEEVEETESTPVKGRKKV